MRTAATQSELVIARRAMACEFSVTLPAVTARPVDAAGAALDEIERLEERLSVYRDDSCVARLNRDAAREPVCVDPELYGMLRAACRWSAAVGGAFDPAVGALVKAWGFFRPPRRVPAAAHLAEALECSGAHRVRFDDERRSIAFARPGVEFNLGAAGKGFALDRALRVLRRGSPGLRGALLQGGQSSIIAFQSPPGEARGWPLALPHPFAASARPLALIHLRNRALGTSGDTNQFFVHEGVRYGHILDPRSGRPANSGGRILSVSVLAPTAAEADAFSTAFYVIGPERAGVFCRRNPVLAAVFVLAAQTNQPEVEVMVLGDADVEVLL